MGSPVYQTAVQDHADAIIHAFPRETNPGLELAKRFTKRCETVPAGMELYAEGEQCGNLYIVTSGWIILHQILEDGRRQILDFALPGTLLGLQPDAGNEMPHTAEALTDAEVAVIPLNRLVESLRGNADIAWRFIAATAGALNVAYDSLTDVGRRTAREAVAHLLLRLFTRVQAQGGGLDDATIRFPLTQEHIGDALGLTAVHVCRTLKSLREDRIMQAGFGILTVLDPEELAEIAGANIGSIPYPVIADGPHLAHMAA